MLSITDMQKAYKERILIEQKMSKGEFDNHPWQFCPTLSRFVANSNITSRWWERRIANLLDWDTQPKSKDPNDEQDYGDLFAPPFVLGEDNIESTHSIILVEIKWGSSRSRRGAWRRRVAQHPSCHRPGRCAGRCAARRR